MTERDEGRATLKALSPGTFEGQVEYLIIHRTAMRDNQYGLPPVTETSSSVEFIRSIDGRQIPQGEYLLECPGSHLPGNCGPARQQFLTPHADVCPFVLTTLKLR